MEQDTSVEDGYETILNIGIEKLTITNIPAYDK